ncbi:intein-containing ribonucleotide reductase [Synechococcus sp. PCC 7336]|uniref:intein-containing ribonucleotide reductase n=1 Tax=Synechococcus sp. PCC 7336 TaxID=195250 RepID=UPI000346024E|nr:intein-containing ribonucleotide reductase [Synechococcus sp. PCC 7336]
MEFITPEQIDRASQTPVPYGPLGAVVDTRTYLRYLPEQQRRETPWERNARVTNYNISLAIGMQSEGELQAEAELMFDRFNQLKAWASGRVAWIGGTKITDTVPEACFNCSALAVDRLASFTEAFHLLMLGCGVGFRVLPTDVEQLPQFRQDFKVESLPVELRPAAERQESTTLELDGPVARVTVGDSRQGWVDALGLLLELASENSEFESIEYNFNHVRPYGDRIKGFGGTASGYTPLQKMLLEASNIICSAPSPQLRPIDAMDIMCCIGNCVVAGNVRRSAEICLFDPSDTETANAKRGLWTDEKLAHKRYRSMSNNSGVYFERPEKSFLRELFQVIRYEGEPGFINGAGHKSRRLAAAQQWRPDEPASNYVDNAGLTNPCVTADTWIHTGEGPRQVRDLIGVQHSTYVNGELFSTTSQGFWQTGTKPVLALKTEEGYELRLTDNHQVLKVAAQTRSHQYTEWVEAGQLQPGDRIALHNHRGLQPWDGSGTFEEGWLLGNLVGDGTFSHDVQSSPNKAPLAHLRYWGEDRDRVSQQALTMVKATVKHRSDLGTVENAANGYTSIASKGLAELAADFGIRAGHKTIAPEVEQSSYDFHRGFLRGLFDADGSVQGSQEKGVSVRLTQANLPLLKAAQRMLARLGIASQIYCDRHPAGERRLPDGKGGYALFECRATHELVIAKDNLQEYAAAVGFQEPAKADKLTQLLSNYRRTPYRERFTATVAEVVPAGVEAVYDCTVPGPARFDANGIVVHNCAEILLSSGYGGEKAGSFCNLTALPLPVFVKEKAEGGCEVDYEELEISLRLITRIGLRQTCVEISLPLWDMTQKQERLLGVDCCGWVELFDKLGWGVDSDEANWLRKWCHDIANDEATRYAEVLGVPRPLLVTTNKPNGTYAQLNTIASGLHWPYAPFYLRRVRMSRTDALALTLRDKGVPIYPESFVLDGLPEARGETIWEKLDWYRNLPAEARDRVLEKSDTWVLEFPVKTAARRKSSDVSAIEQLENYRCTAKYYCDHNASVTITVADDEWDDVVDWVYDNWEDFVGISFLPKSADDVYPLLPYQAISEAEYEQRARSAVFSVDFDRLAFYERLMDDPDAVDLEADCVGGACPVR